MDDFQRKARAADRALDELLALYGEKRTLQEIRDANARAWERRKRRAHMRLVIGAGMLIASGSASAALLQTAPPTKHPVLEWWPVIVAAITFVGFVVMLRAQSTQTALELAKKADREIIDLKFKGLEDRIDAKLEGIKDLIEGLRREMEHNRTRRADTA